METLKTCSKCGQAKPIDAFSMRSKSRDGLREMCKACQSYYGSIYRNANPEKIKAKDAAYRNANPEKIKEKSLNYYNNNIETISLRKSNYYRNNIEKIKPTLINYYKNNSQKIKSNTSKWKKSNPEKVREYAAESVRKLPDYYITHLLTQKTLLKAGDIPKELIEAKRLHIQLIREIKELNK